MGKRGRKDPNIETGRWTKEQHQRFMEGLLTYGKNWKMVEQIVGTRTASQVRSHAQKFFYRLDREQRKMKKTDNSGGDEQSEPVSVEPDVQQESELCQQETPEQIMSLIRQNSKQDKRVNVGNFLDSLRKESNMIEEDIKQRKSSEEEPTNIVTLQRKNSQLKLMANLVESYSNLCELSEKDESFFINMIKRYKRYLLGHRFLDLVDYPCHQQLTESLDAVEKKVRKRSFHLVEETDENEKLLTNFRNKAKQDNRAPEDSPRESEVQKPTNGTGKDEGEHITETQKQENLPTLNVVAPPDEQPPAALG